MKTSIEWTDFRWNPVRGCSRISRGCEHCYAERMAARNLPGMRSPTTGKPYARMTPQGPHWTGRVELIPEKLDEPLRWRKPRKVFVNSMSDLFHESLPDEAIDRVFAVMALSPQHTFQILTKRPKWMLEYLGGDARLAIAEAIELRSWAPETHDDFDARDVEPLETWPLPNVWLGVSPHDQESADGTIPLLLQTPAAKRFVSLEPMLGPVDFQGPMDCRSCDGDGENRNGNACEACHTTGERDRRWLSCRYHPSGSCVCGTTLDQVIVGGESGPGARPCDVAWIRSVVRQCREAGVACFVKQGGASNRCEHSSKGGHFECFPPDLQVREFPR